MKAVLFDLGHVLVHYDHAQTIAGVASQCAAPLDSVGALIERVRSDLEVGRLDEQGFYALMRENAGATDDMEAFTAGFASGLARDEDALAYATELERRDDVIVGVISNTTEAHVHWLDANVPELRDFDLVMMSNEIGMHKPDPAVFRLALELLDIPAANALFVDDLAENVAGAKSVGMAGIVHASWPETRALIESWLAAQPAA